MALETANEFVRKTFNDDEFLKEVIRHGGFNDKAPDEEKTFLITKAAKELGYDVTEDEYTEASGAYFKELGVFGVIKTLRHVGKVVKKVRKEK